MKSFKQFRETKSGEIKIVADTNSRKYKEGEVIKTFPETDKGLNQAMVFQKSVKNKLGIDTKMVRESLDDVEEMSALTKIKAKLARAARGPSKKATPTMFRQTGKSARKVQQRAAKSKAYELGRKAREK